ncbi:hypothetical protein M2318_004506, partial [Metapseudomonas resinovorans]
MVEKLTWAFLDECFDYQKDWYRARSQRPLSQRERGVDPGRGEQRRSVTAEVGVADVLV